MFDAKKSIYRDPIFWVLSALTIIALVLGLGLVYFSSDVHSLFKQQVQYQNLSNTLNDLEFNLTNAETGQRGYLITQDQTYLVPYKTALPDVQKDLSTLKKSPLTTGYAAEVNTIRTTSTKKIDEMNLTISTLQSQGQAAAFQIVDNNSGITDMNTLRKLIGWISSDQNAKLQSRINRGERITDVLEYVAPLTAVLDIILISFVSSLTRRAIRKEQQLENLKEQFVAIASHQLRTPATAVKQYLNLLLVGTFGKLTKQQKDVLEVINQSNERGIQVANNLINVSRADNQELQISDEPVNLSELLKHILGHYTEAIKGSRQQRIQLDMPKQAIKAKVDPFYVRLIFENLLENASKYSSNNKQIYVSLKTSESVITFRVRDQGIGIAEKDIPLLFKKFSRLDPAMKQTEGSGLGLYLVKQAAELHGGEVHISSVPGKGSTFTVTIRKDL